MAGAIGSPCSTQNLVTVTTPWGIKVTVNKAVRRRFMLACRRAYECGWKPKRIDSYNCRPIRGSSTMSRHAFGCAWDFFFTGPTVPPPGGVWKPSNTFGENFAKAFEDLGFTWGRRWDRADWPHIEWSFSTVPELNRAEIDRTRKLHNARLEKARKKRGGR